MHTAEVQITAPQTRGAVATGNLNATVASNLFISFFLSTLGVQQYVHVTVGRKSSDVVGFLVPHGHGH